MLLVESRVRMEKESKVKKARYNNNRERTKKYEYCNKNVKNVKKASNILVGNYALRTHERPDNHRGFTLRWEGTL